MKLSIQKEINKLGSKLLQKTNKTIYDIPSEKQITIGDNTVIDGLCLEDGDYKGVPFANGYLEVCNINFTLALDVMSDEIGYQICNILKNALYTKRYVFNDLADILGDLRDYIQDMPEEEMKRYFKEITSTGFFHDAVGKVVGYDKDGEYVEVTEDY